MDVLDLPDNLGWTREDFAAHRHKMLESADSVIRPAVTRALKRYPNGQWWTPILDAAERVFRRSFRRETGTNKHPLLQSEVDQFRNQIQGNLMQTREVGSNTATRLTKWISTAATNAGVEFATRHDPEHQVDREWVTMHDNRVRTAHRHTDGQKRGVGGSFLVGPDDGGRFAVMRYPGDPRAPVGFWINCRCVLRPVASLTSGGAMTETLPDTEPGADIEFAPIPWHGVLAPEGKWSGDKRRFKAEALRWRDLPLPLTWQKISDDGHKGGVTVARIDRVFRDGNLIKGEGVWDTSDDAGEALRQVAEGMLRGVSVDVDDHTVEAAEDDDSMSPSLTFTSGRICGATLVGIPAFQEAFVQLGTWAEADNPTQVEEDSGAEADSGLITQDGDGGTAIVAQHATIEAFAISEKAWDGSPGRFTDEQYVRSCLIKGKGKSDSHLPILEPNGDLSRAGVHAAASRINQTSATPEQKASAKAKLRGAYKKLGEDPPDAIKASAETEEFGRGPGWVTNPIATRRLHDYWVHGPGAAKISWGVPGDFNRCRVEVGEEIGESDPGKLRFLNQICAQWHHDALGIWPGRPVSGETVAFDKENEMAPSVTLAASAATPTHRAEFFADPNLVGPSPLVVSREGRVFGHLATWDTCHIGIGNQCVQAPHSATDYAYFKTGSVLTDKGEIATGKITLGGGHAEPNLGYRATAEHYDSTSSVVADITVGDDEFGIWVSGQVRPGTTDEQIAAMRAAPLSGDWRKIGNNLELVAALSVNVPGFPIPHLSLAASGESLTSLTAAGVLEPEPPRALTAGDVADELERRARVRRIASLRVDRNRQKMAALAASAGGQ